MYVFQNLFKQEAVEGKEFSNSLPRHCVGIFPFLPLFAKKNLLVFKVWNMRSMHTKWRQTWFNWHMQSVCCWIDFYRKLELIRVFSEITIQWQAVIRNNVCRLGRFMSVGSVFHFKDFSLTKANLFNNMLGKLITFWSDFISYKSLAKTRFFTTWATNPLLNNFGMDF